MNTDASLKSSIKSLIFVTVGCKVRLDAVSIAVTVVSDEAFTNNTVESLIGSARLARSKNPEETFIAIALTVFEVAVQTTVLVAAALPIEDRETCIADTATAFNIEVAVEGADIGDNTFALVKSGSIVALAHTINIGLI